MTLLWLWVYGLKFPLGILCGVGIFACFLGFVHASKTSRPGDPKSFFTSVYIAITIGVIWALIYAIPSPTYDQKVVEKVKVVEKKVPMVRTVTKYAGTKIVYRLPDVMQRTMWCNDHTQNSLEDCTTWSKRFEEPRIVVKTQRVEVPVYKGIREVPMKKERLIIYCLSVAKDRGWNYNLDDCADWSKKVMGQDVKVVVKHDSYMDIFKWCNETYSIDGEPNAGQLRNERLKVCQDAAMKGSR